MKFKDYSWALEGVAALVLLIGFVTMLITGTENLSNIVVQVIGLGILFFTLIRIRPILASRNDKDYIIIMLLEILIDITAGIMMLGFSDFVLSDKFFTFSRLTGAVFYIRGICHFYTTAKRYELHDLISFVVHILFISFGFLFLALGKLEAKDIVYAIYALTILLIGYFSYRSYKGYGHFRIQKGNKLKMTDYLEKDKPKEKEDVLEDPKSIEDQINPKKIDEPEKERPSVDIN